KTWRFKAIAQHVLTPDAQKLTWSSIDEIAIIDLKALKKTMAAEEIEKKKSIKKNLKTSYAFTARYVDKTKDDMIAAGIAWQPFARAGFPTREIVEALKAGTATEELLVTGAAVTDIVTTKATLHDVARGVTIAQPVLAPRAAGKGLGALNEIPQAPQPPPQASPVAPIELRVSGYDLANMIERPFYGRPPVPVSAGDGSLPAMERTLNAIFQRGSSWSSMPIDQTFS